MISEEKAIYQSNTVKLLLISAFSSLIMQTARDSLDYGSALFTETDVYPSGRPLKFMTMTTRTEYFVELIISL